MTSLLTQEFWKLSLINTHEAFRNYSNGHHRKALREINNCIFTVGFECHPVNMGRSNEEENKILNSSSLMSCSHCVNWMRQMSSIKRIFHNLIKGSIRKYDYTRVLNKIAQQILILACLLSTCLIFATLITLWDVTVLWKHWFNALMLKRKQTIQKGKKSISNFGEGDSECNRKCNHVVILYLLTPRCILPWIFFFNLIIAFQKTHIIARKYRGRQQDNQMAFAGKNSEETIRL